MDDMLSLDLVDQDGAIREARDRASGGTRADLFRKTVVGGGTFLAGGLLISGLPSVALGKPSAAQDVEILNFALLLEYLESSFYVEAVQRANLSGATRRFATTVRDHELAHVAFLRKVLGSKAIRKPSFDFKGTTSDPARFVATAVVLEDTGVAAYNGQGANLTKATLGAAATIVSVEARHAAWIRRIASGPDYAQRPGSFPAPAAFNPSLTRKQVESAVAATGFIQG